MIEKLPEYTEQGMPPGLAKTLDPVFRDKINEIVDYLNQREQREEAGREYLRKNIKPMD